MSKTEELLKVWTELSPRQQTAFLQIGAELAKANEAHEKAAGRMAAYEGPYYTPEEIEERFGIRAWTVRRAHKKGLLEGMLPLGQVRGRRYSETEVLDYLDKCKS